RRGASLLGFAAVVGHVFPITFRFRGGRGVATAAGVLAVIFPWIALGLALLWFAIARGLGKASVASIVGTIAFPVLVAVTGNSWGGIVITSGLALVVLVRHVPNLRRLLRCHEHWLGRAPPGGGVCERGRRGGRRGSPPAGWARVACTRARASERRCSPASTVRRSSTSWKRPSAPGSATSSS